MTQSERPGFFRQQQQPLFRQKKQQQYQFLKRPLFYFALLCQLLLIFLYVRVYLFWEPAYQQQLLKQNLEHQHPLHKQRLQGRHLQQQGSAPIQCTVKQTVFVEEDRRKALGEFRAVANFVIQYALPAQLPPDEPVDSREFPVRKLRSVDKVTNGSVPGVSDINIELNDYSKRLLRNFVPDFQTAQKRQDLVLANQLGIQDVWDNVVNRRTVSAQLALLNSLGQQTAHTGICMYATVADDMSKLRQLVLPWMMYHTEIGVQKFFIYYYGQDEEVVGVLEQVKHLELIFAEGKHAPLMERQLNGLWKEKHNEKFKGDFDGDKGRLFRTSMGVEVALNNAREQGKCRWMFNLDVDELIRPGHPNFSLEKVMKEFPEDVGIVNFVNFEGQPEAGDIRNRFEQVTLFRTHAQFVSQEAYSHRSKFRLGQNRAHLSFYADGRSAVRLDFPHFFPHGIHPHHYTLEYSQAGSNPQIPSIKPRRVISNDTVILHYAYSQLEDVMEPSDSVRAPCYRGQSSDCYFTGFDVDAENVAKIEDAAKFFYNRMVLSEGSPIRCKLDSGEEGWCSVEDVEYLKQLATRSGLMYRFFEPQMLLRGHQRIVKLILDALGPSDEKADLSIDIIGPKAAGDTYKDFLQLVEQENERYKSKLTDLQVSAYPEKQRIPEFNLLWGSQENQLNNVQQI
eukprot:TRINITY_DN1527_c0_g3_i1.p1 TRINITY_DN1527_c0_g3~~TRINITY_DN1527_c0_g3_i1.p1  ORF type:complete len:678 (-),score=70.91 TRINITY_DN1527_c0_g3_i1:363-2396(-)